MSEIDLLPRADLPVLFNEFKLAADVVWDSVNSLVVTDISQKESMALARKTRLTLREIRIAVEHRRVELGEGHLTEIQKINGAARAIREFIEPLEARLLDQETFADRAEAMRIATLADSRLVELKALKVCQYSTDLGTMKQEDYDAYIARLRAEKAEIEVANRLRVEAEKRLAEAQAKALLDAEIALAEKAADSARRAEAWAEAQRNERAIRAEAAALLLAQQAEAKAEQERQHKAYLAENEARLAAAEAERAEERKAAQALAEVTRANIKVEQERLEAQAAIRNADLAEQKRIRDEQFAKLEAELAQERAAKQAEADAARKLALAPDVEKLRAFWVTMRSIPNPELKTDEAIACLMQARYSFTQALSVIETFCQD